MQHITGIGKSPNAELGWEDGQPMKAIIANGPLEALRFRIPCLSSCIFRLAHLRVGTLQFFEAMPGPSTKDDS